MRYPHLATAVDVIGTKFFHAFGYNVPQNFIAYFRREQLDVDPDAHFTRGCPGSSRVGHAHSGVSR